MNTDDQKDIKDAIALLNKKGSIEKAMLEAKKISEEIKELIKLRTLSKKVMR